MPMKEFSAMGTELAFKILRQAEISTVNSS